MQVSSLPNTNLRFDSLKQMKFIGYHRFITVGCELALLVLFLWLNQTWQHPVQSSKSCSSNVSCAPTTTSFTVNEDNVTLHVDTDPSGPLNNTESPLINSSGLAQFNDRRRDIFLEDYANSIKQIEIVDTKQVTFNNVYVNSIMFCNYRTFPTWTRQYAQTPL